MPSRIAATGRSSSVGRSLRVGPQIAVGRQLAAAAVQVPGTLTASVISSSEIDLSVADTNGGAAQTHFQKALASTGAWSDVVITAAGVLTAQALNLAAGTPYFFRASAILGGVESAFGAVVSATTSGAQSAPAAPSNLVVGSPTASTLTLTFVDNATNEQGFYVERAPDSSGAPGTFVRVATLGPSTGSGATVTYTNPNLAAGTTYWYRVQAYNAQGTSAYTSNASGTTSALASPYYVDPVNGTDDAGHGIGTGTSAWKTIKFGLGQLAGLTNWTLVLAAGTYNETGTVVSGTSTCVGVPTTCSGAAGAVNTILGAPNYGSVITQTNQTTNVCGIYVAASYFTVDGVKVTGCGKEGVRQTGGHVTVQNCLIDTNGYYGCGVGSVTVTNAGSGGTAGTYALAFSGASGTGAAGTFTVGTGGTITATSITAAGFGYVCGAGMSRPTVSFAACPGLAGAAGTVAMASGNFGGTGIQNGVPSDSFSVVNNTCQYNREHGVYVADGMTNLAVRGNTLIYNGQLDRSLGGLGLHCNANSGNATTGAVIEQNVFHDNLGMSFDLAQYQSCTVRNNLSYNGKVQIYQGSHDNVIVFNTFYASVWTNYAGTSTTAAPVYVFNSAGKDGSKSTNNTFFGNIFVCTVSIKLAISLDSTLTLNSATDYNTYYTNNGGTTSSTALLVAIGSTKYTLTGATNSLQTTLGIDAHSTYGNPSFVNTSAGNFQLTSGSAGEAGAAAYTGIVNDLNGTARPNNSGVGNTSAYDCGCYQRTTH